MAAPIAAAPLLAYYWTFLFLTLRKCCMLLLCQPSQREVTEQNSTKLYDMLRNEPFANARQKLKGFSPLKSGSY